MARDDQTPGSDRPGWDGAGSDYPGFDRPGSGDEERWRASQRQVPAAEPVRPRHGITNDDLDAAQTALIPVSGRGDPTGEAAASEAADPQVTNDGPTDPPTDDPGADQQATEKGGTEKDGTENDGTEEDGNEKDAAAKDAAANDAAAAAPSRRRRVGRRRAVEAPRRVRKAELPPVIPPGPVLVAAGLGLLGKQGWVFKDIELTLRPASVAAIVSPAGTGRSCLLMALSGRMAANAGTLTVAGHTFADRPKAVRALTAVARIGSSVGPEPGLTVEQSIAEQSLLEDVRVSVGRERFDGACRALGITMDPAALAGSMAGDQATLFAVALACVRMSAVIVLDDLDRNVSGAVTQRMLHALIRLARTGPTILVSTTDRVPVMDADVVLDLTPSEGPTMWQLGPIVAPQVIAPVQLDFNAPHAPELGPGAVPPPPLPPDSSGWAPDGPGDDPADAPTEDLR